MLLTQMKPVVLDVPHLDHVHPPAALQSAVYLPTSILMPPSKRPKLSLQTNQLPISYGAPGNATGNVLNLLSTTTPTTFNTFNNSFELSVRPSPTSSTASPIHRVKSAASPLKRNHPYSLNLPLGLRPILKNSRLARECRSSSLTASASPRGGRRVFFPPVKKVTFQLIEEEITTQKYTARHIDLSSSEDEENSEREGSEEPGQSKTIAVEHVDDNDEHPIAPSSTTGSISPQNPEHEKRGRLRGHRSPSTVRPKRKRRRWEWTLDELQKDDPDPSPSQSMMTEQSHIDTAQLAVIPESPSPTHSIVGTETSLQKSCPSPRPYETTLDPITTSPTLQTDPAVSADDLTPLITPVPPGYPTSLNIAEPLSPAETITALAASTPLPPSPLETSRPSHVQAMIKWFEGVKRQRSDE
jgi:hypothetical protein